MPGRLSGKAWWVWALQGALLVVVVAFVVRALAGRWEEFRTLDVALRLQPGWIGVSAAVVLATYALLIAAWRLVIVGWGERLGLAAAARVWTLANLGRYVPGRVWGLAGLAVLAQREGVAGWATVGAAVAMQAIAVGSGVAVVVAAAPGAASLGALTAAAAVAAATIAALVAPPVVALVARLTRRPDLRPLPARTVVVAGAVATVSWLGYGVAFWALVRGVLGANALPLGTASGVFAAGYLVGLIAIFAPGGVGVREAVFLALLTPTLGTGGALAVSIASRVLLTATEALAALAAAASGWVMARRSSGSRGG